MEPRVFRGVGVGRASARVAAITIAYVGAFLVLWAMGLMIRGPLGWVLATAPLAAIVGARVWVWQRVSVAVADGVLRYEGATPERDFEVGVADIDAVYFDATLPGEPLVLSLHDGDERVCGELSRRASDALYVFLRGAGVRDGRDVSARGVA